MKEVIKRSECPVSFCLDFFGDKWTLLIMRDMIFNDKITFGDFLSSDESMATNILTDRLKMLETAGFILKHPVPGKARIGYCLTEKGITIIPIVIEMAEWGASQGMHGFREEIGIAIKKDKQGYIQQLARSHKRKLKTIEKNLEENR